MYTEKYIIKEYEKYIIIKYSTKSTHIHMGELTV